MTRALVMQLMSALDYHQFHTRPMQYSKDAIQAAREYLATEPSGERADSAQWLREFAAMEFSYYSREATQLRKSADMLEADAQQATPTGWDNGLSQDYCAEFGKWLASRPGARQQIKEMFEAADESEDLK